MAPCLLRFLPCLSVNRYPEGYSIGEVETCEGKEVEPHASIEDLEKSVYNSPEPVRARPTTEVSVDILGRSLELFLFEIRSDIVIVTDFPNKNTHSKVPVVLQILIVAYQFLRQNLELIFRDLLLSEARSGHFHFSQSL